MFADVSGFTALSEAMSRYGPEGAEKIAANLNKYFGMMVKTIASMGGDVFKVSVAAAAAASGPLCPTGRPLSAAQRPMTPLHMSRTPRASLHVQFAGDALLVLWPDTSDDTMTQEDKVLRAGQCALQIQQELHNADLEEGVRLSVKIGIGVGAVSVLHLGGVLRRMEYVAVGEPLTQAFNAEHHCDAGGEVVLSKEAAAMVKDKFAIIDDLDDGCVRISKNGRGECLRQVKKINIANMMRDRGLAEAGDDVEKRLRSYVAGAILPWLKPECPDLEIWGSDLRNVTVLFINLGLKEMHMQAAALYEEAMRNMHEVLKAAQGAVYQYEGAVNKCLNDDKGSTMIAVFGLPPLSHEDDSTRGVMCALAICERLWGHGLIASVGVTTGVVFCGVVGSKTRKEYTILGDTVNLSARLMQQSQSIGGGVLVDLQVRRASSQGLAFQELPAVKVKGKTMPIRIFRPYPSGLMKHLPCKPKLSSSMSMMGGAGAGGAGGKGDGVREFSPLRMAYEAQLVGYRVHRLLRPLELPPPIQGDGIKDPGEVAAAAAAAASPSGGAGAGGAAAGGTSDGAGRRPGFAGTGVSMRRGTSLFGPGASSGSLGGAGGPGRPSVTVGALGSSSGSGGPAGDHVLTSDEVFGTSHLTASGGSSDGDAAVDDDGLPLADTFTVGRRVKDGSAELSGGAGSSSTSSSSSSSGAAARRRAVSGAPGGKGAVSHLSRAELPLVKLRCLLSKPPAPVTRDNATFRGLQVVSSLLVHVPADLACPEALDVRVSYDIADGAFLSSPVAVPVKETEEADAKDGDADADAGPRPDLPRSLAALRDAVVAAAKAEGKIHPTVPAGDFLLRIHGSDALLPVSYSLPLIYLWVFLAESGALVLGDVLTGENALKVQLVRARDRHVLQGMQAIAMQKLIEGKLALSATRQGGTMLIEGEYGLGKTALLARFVGDVLPGTTSVFCAAGSPYTRTAPYEYAAWADVMQQFLREYRDMRALPSSTEAAAELLAAHAINPTVASLGCLLNSILLLELPVNPIAERLKPRERHRALRGLFVSLLRGMAAETPALITIDDGHFMHKASWDVCRDVATAATLPPGAPGSLAVQLVVASRPIAHYLDVVTPDVPPSYVRLQNTQAVEHVRLARLPTADATVVLAATVKWGGLLSQDVIRLLDGKTHGNPAMIQEVMLSLMASGRLMSIESASPQANSGGGLVTSGLPRLVALHVRSSTSSAKHTAAASQLPTVGAQLSFRDLYADSTLKSAIDMGPGGPVPATGGAGGSSSSGGGSSSGSSDSSSSGSSGSSSTALVLSSGESSEPPSQAAALAQAAVAAGAGLARIGVGWVSITGLLGPVGGLVHRKATLLGCDPVTAAPNAVLILTDGLSGTHVPYCRRAHWSISARVDRLRLYEQLVLKVGSMLGRMMRNTLAAVNPSSTAATPLALLTQGTAMSPLSGAGGLGGSGAGAGAAGVGAAGAAGAGAGADGAATTGAAARAGGAPASPAGGAGAGASGAVPPSPLGAPAVSAAESLGRRRATLATGTKAATLAIASSGGSGGSSASAAAERFNHTFRFNMLLEAFPRNLMPDQNPASLAAICISLTRMGILTHGYVRGAPRSGTVAEAVFSFNSGFLQDTVRLRMLASQQQGLEKVIRDAIDRFEDALTRNLMGKTLGDPGVIGALGGAAGGGAMQKMGWLQVRKNPNTATFFRSFTAEWKRRWLVLLPDRIDMHKDQVAAGGGAAAAAAGHKPVQSIYLRGASASIVSGSPSHVRESLGAEHVIEIRASSWEKGGKAASGPRTFFVSAETRGEVDEWLLFLKSTISVLSDRGGSAARAAAGGSGGGSAGAGAASSGGGSAPHGRSHSFVQPSAGMAAAAAAAAGAARGAAVSADHVRLGTGAASAAGSSEGVAGAGAAGSSGAIVVSAPGAGAAGRRGAPTPAMMLAGKRLLRSFAPAPSASMLQGDRLVVLVAEAQRLSPGKAAGVPNVYVTLQLEQALVATTTAPGSLDPIWNVSLGFPVTASQAAQGTVIVRVWDRDREGADQLLGSALLRLSSLVPTPIDPAQEASSASRASAAAAAASDGSSGADGSIAAAESVLAESGASGSDVATGTGLDSAAEEEDAVADGTELVLFLANARGTAALTPNPRTAAAAAAASAASAARKAAAAAAAASAAAAEDSFSLSSTGGGRPANRFSFRHSASAQGYGFLSTVRDAAGRSYPNPGFGVIVLRAKLMLAPATIAAVTSARAATAIRTDAETATDTLRAIADNFGVPPLPPVGAAAAAPASGGAGASAAPASTPLPAGSLLNEAALTAAATQVMTSWREGGSGAGAGGDGTGSPLLLEDHFDWIHDPASLKDADGGAGAAAGSAGTGTGSAAGDGPIDTGGGRSARPTGVALGAGGGGFSPGGSGARTPLGQMRRPVSMRVSTMPGFNPSGSTSEDASTSRATLARGSMARVGSTPLLAVSGTGSLSRSSSVLGMGALAGVATGGLGTGRAARGSVAALAQAVAGSAGGLSGMAAAAAASVGGDGGGGAGRRSRTSLAHTIVAGARASMAGGDGGSGGGMGIGGVLAGAVGAHGVAGAGGIPGAVAEIAGAVRSLAQVLLTLSAEAKRAAVAGVSSASSPASSESVPSDAFGPVSPRLHHVKSRSFAVKGSGAAGGGAASSTPASSPGDGSDNDEAGDEVLPLPGEAGGAGRGARSGRFGAAAVDEATAQPHALAAGVPASGELRVQAGRLAETCTTLANVIELLQGACAAVVADTDSAVGISGGSGSGDGGSGGGSGGGSSVAVGGREDAHTTSVVLAAMTAMDVDEQSKRWLATEYMRGAPAAAAGAADTPPKPATASAGAGSPAGRPKSAGPGAKPTAAGAGAAAAAAPSSSSVRTGSGPGSTAPASALAGPQALPSGSVWHSVELDANRTSLSHVQRTLGLPGDLLAGPGSDECGSGWLGWGMTSLVGVRMGLVAEGTTAGAADADSDGGTAAEGSVDASLGDAGAASIPGMAADALTVPVSEVDLRRLHRAADAYDRIFWEDAEDAMHGPYTASAVIEWADEGHLPSDALVRPGAPSAEKVVLSEIVDQLRVRAHIKTARELALRGGSLDAWTFDIWALNAETPEALLPLPVYIILRLRLPRFFAMQPRSVLGFLSDVCTHMSRTPEATPYHNFWHAVDVMQTVSALLVQMNAGKLFTPVETMALVIGGLCHDLEHPGFNNLYLINSNAELALTYNDASVLESHHAALASKLLLRHGVVDGMTKPQYREFRRVMLAGILATDMTCHFSLTDELKRVGMANSGRIRHLLGSQTHFHHRPPLHKVSGADGGGGAGDGALSSSPAASNSATSPSSSPPASGAGEESVLTDISPADRLVMIKNFLHAADISNPTKPWALCKTWSDRVLQEFFVQGDRERREGLPLSPNTDRAVVKQSQMSVNFIDFVVAPLFIALASMLPGAQLCVDILNDNRTRWSEALKSEIAADSGTSASARAEATQKWERRDTVFNKVLMPLVQEASASAPSEKDKEHRDAGKEDGDDEDDDDDEEAEEVSATARVLTLNALETMAVVAAANKSAAATAADKR